MANSLTPMIGFLHIRGRRGSCEVHFLRWRRATPVYSLQSALSPTGTQLQVPSHAGDSGKGDAKSDMNLPGACRAAATPLALDLAPRGSARLVVARVILDTPRVVRGHCPHPIASSCAIASERRLDDPYGALAWPERRQCCDELEFAPDWPVRCELQVHHATSSEIIQT